jgi:hypothetical protein
VNRILVYPVFGDHSVWLPEGDLELVQDLTAREANARRVFWTSVALTFMTAIPVQWYLIQHGVPSWGAAAIAVFAGSGATDIVFRALRIPTR